MDDQERYEILKKEVDSIQIQLSQENAPWYTKPSTLISVIALLFSFSTTIVSYINSHNEDIRANHREATAIIQRLSKLPIENFEFMQRNKGNAQGEALTGMITQETIILATQASNLVSKYPDTFSAAEFYAIATALQYGNIVNKAPAFFENAIKKAETSNDYSVMARSYAYYLYSKGDYTEGKKFFDQALRVWNTFSERNMDIVNSTDLLTYETWSKAELMAKNIIEAEKKINLAKDKLAQLPRNPSMQYFADQINNTVDLIEKAKASGMH
jgi:tetratricopeptide (TPR) repeat protein